MTPNIQQFIYKCVYSNFWRKITMAASFRHLSNVFVQLNNHIRDNDGKPIIYDFKSHNFELSRDNRSSFYATVLLKKQWCEILLA